MPLRSTRFESEKARLLETKMHSIHRGFTLIELLVVILIISILVALLFPLAKSVIRSAQTTRCLGNQHTLASACITFAADHSGMLPASYITAGTAHAGDWYSDVQPYINITNFTKKLRCPVVSPTNVNVTIGVHQGNAGQPGPCVKGDYVERKRLASIPSRTLLVGDTDNNVGVFLNPVCWPFSTDQDGDGIRDSYASTLYNGLGFRHGSNAPVVCVDGSAKIITVKEWIGNSNNVWGIQKP